MPGSLPLKQLVFFLGMLTQANIPSWYEELNKSGLTPPGPVFSIVWSILYALLAIVAWVLWCSRNESEMRSVFYLYSVQMLMNWAWTPLFFVLHWTGLGFLWILVMADLTGLLILSLKNKKESIAILLLPYLVWLLFAAYLNGMIWLLN
ncbi:tryptophan rich sensory protein TspO [Legionella pneumophila]|uniref:TspO/MBR family protein n=1 Tax=Legionella pneumophila TaxID=446 RepID=UPI000E03F4F4|nr:TspO/MBR family protein [Legionella pneumophila]HAT9005762.1 tryptophan-rich sensory protein [Legionella pneumophila subsp. pneumophila]MCZ4780869.1 tryptophan-rich sensory protein [Legionella pneumophila]MDW8980805.1 TspO/MBR family protein [Legionella pneumophila]MDW9018070.1 TspO/MBR family protein [Legionella pneumophila]MDW9106205.1 TspO/MBR family protein [Legionella pneumophila]